MRISDWSSDVCSSDLRLLVADEPTGNLDPSLSAEIMALFSSLPERGTSVLVASHDLGLVKRMKRRGLVRDHGQLADAIPPEELADALRRRQPYARPPPPGGGNGTRAARERVGQSVWNPG